MRKWITKPKTSEQLERAELALARLIALPQRAAPDTLWHYTNADGLKGIIESGRLRFTHIRFLNDPTEARYAWEVIGQELSRAFPREKPYDEIYRSLQGMIESCSGSAQSFVHALSSRRDSLSQWRAYGALGGGYCIGFDSNGLAEHFGSKRFRLLRMLYEEQEQIEVVRQGISIACETIDECRSLSSEAQEEVALEGVTQLLSRYLVDASMLLKHPRFADEQEWRLLYLVDEKPSRPEKVQFRVAEGIVKPHIDIEAADHGRVQLREIIHGPTLHPSLTKESLEYFLGYHGYGEVPVRASDVPLQFR